jgi:hypothetical protein
MAMNPLRDAILDAIDARDEAVRCVGEACMLHGNATVTPAAIVAAVPPQATEADVAQALASVEHDVRAMLVHAQIVAMGHAGEHVPRVRAAGKGRDEGPIRREHVEARRAARGMAGR